MLHVAIIVLPYTVMQKKSLTCCPDVFVFVFIVHSLDLYKAKSPLVIELVNG